MKICRMDSLALRDYRRISLTDPVKEFNSAFSEGSQQGSYRILNCQLVLLNPSLDIGKYLTFFSLSRGDCLQIRIPHLIISPFHYPLGNSTLSLLDHSIYIACFLLLRIC
jgi:hypothetical protein